MNTVARFFLVTASMPMMAASIFAQAAVSSSTNPQETATPQISPTPPQNEAAPRIPAIDELDQAFKQSSLGKAADEARLHAQLRELSNHFINDHDLVEARANAGRAKTDLEKRHRLRAYYTMFYDRMRAQASSQELKNYIDTHKAQHLAILAQNRVRPSPAPPAAPAAGKKEANEIASPKPKLRVPEPPLPQ